MSGTLNLAECNRGIHLATWEDRRCEAAFGRVLQESCESIVRSAQTQGLCVQLTRQMKGSCPIAWRETVLRVVDELVSNAVEHGFYRRQSGRIFIHVASHADVGLRIVVSDDGWGFGNNRVIDGNGFRLLRSLGDLQIQPSTKHAGVGAEVTLSAVARRDIFSGWVRPAATASGS